MRVPDRFHSLRKLSQSIAKVRASEARQLKAAGSEPLLKNARWLLLTWRRKLSEQQIPRLEEILQHNLDTVRAYLLKEEFRQFLALDTAEPASEFLTRWRKPVKRSKIKPLIKFSTRLRNHQPLILN